MMPFVEVRLILKIFLVAIMLIANNAHSTRAFSGKVTSVTDGNTLWVQADAGGPSRKIRIDGIDAPELCQAGGEASRDVLAQHTLRQHVLVRVRRRDMYGRGLTHIDLNGSDLGAQMVRAGQAWSYRWRRNLGPYAAEEAVARQSRRGLFSVSQPELPRDFRKRHGACYAARR